MSQRRSAGSSGVLRLTVFSSGTRGFPFPGNRLRENGIEITIPYAPMRHRGFYVLYQVFGLWPDFQLCLSSWHLAARFKDANTDAFRYFKYAATFHLVQIFTLLFQGLGFLSPWPAAQFLIMLTAFFNYYYYTHALPLSSTPETLARKRLLTKRRTTLRSGSQRSQATPTARGRASVQPTNRSSSSPRRNARSSSRSSASAARL